MAILGVSMLYIPCKDDRPSAETKVGCSSACGSTACVRPCRD